MTFFTVCNGAQLAEALVLLESVKRYEPRSKRFLGWVDDNEPNVPLGIEVIRKSELATEEEWAKMASQYSDFELVAACRPLVGLKLLEKKLATGVLIFLAPSCELFEDVSPIFASKADFWLSPNTLKPMPANQPLLDRNILNVGMFHSNAWAVRPTDESLGSLKWWASRTKTEAKVDLCNGMFLDQIWLNYMPTWLEKVEIIRTTGWHVGVHSLPHLKLTEEKGEILINGKELLMADFAGMTSYHPLWSDFKEVGKKNIFFKKLANGHEERVEEVRKTSTPANVSEKVSRFRLPRRKGARSLRRLSEWISKVSFGA